MTPRSARLAFAVLFAAAGLCLPLSPARLGAQRRVPDTIFIHGRILTGAHLRPDDRDATPAQVSALAIRGDRILAVGTDAQMLRLEGPQTQVVDLGGAFAMPGFNDAHTHMAQAGRQRLAVDLVGAHSLPEMQARIAAYVAKAEPDQWILGGGWDHTLWATGKLPSRQDLDAVTGAHPAFLERVDGHIAVVNTAALQRAGLTAATHAPAGGALDRDSHGQLTGIVREAPALALIQAHIPPPSYATRKQALELSIRDALAHGVTSVQDYSDWEDWLVLEELEHQGKLHLRFAEWIDFTLPLPVLERRRASHDANDPLLHLTQLKAFMDGSLGSRTATMNAPYSDAPDTSGLPRFEQERLNQMASERAAAGFQLGFHAIGDRANDMALDAFQAAEQVTSRSPSALCPSSDDSTTSGTSLHGSCVPPGDLRFRIEHAQVVSPGAFQRFHDLHVIASMQPSHLLTDMAWAGDRLGPERSRRAYAWRSFLAHGVTLAFGTDYPVESLSPFRGLYSAVTRQNEAGTQTFQPQERISLNEALYAYTQASAFAEFREHIKGRLEPGYLADFVVLDRDITAVSPRALLATRILRTVVGGTTRYLNPGGAAAPVAPAAGRGPAPDDDR